MKRMKETAAAPLSFEQRVKLVQAEIKTRVTKQPANQRNAAQARLWVNWLKRNVLEVA